MFEKRDAALLLLALFLGLIGNLAYRTYHTRTPRLTAGVGPVSAPKNLVASIFARPADPAYAPVNMPSLAPSATARSGAESESPSAERWAGTTGVQYPLGEVDAAGPAYGGNQAASAGRAPPRWQRPNMSAEMSVSGSNGASGAANMAAANSGAPAAAVAPASRGTRSGGTLGRLQRKAARHGAVDVPLGNGGAGIATPRASAPAAAGGTYAPSIYAPAPPGAVAAAASPSSGGSPADVGSGGSSPFGLGSTTGGGGGGADAGGATAGGSDDASATPTPASTDDPSADAPDANATDDSVADVTPTVGSPQVPSGSQVTGSGVFFAEKKGMAPSVQVMNVTVGDAKALEFASGFHVDADGAGGWYIKDKTGKATTSLKYSKTESLDPGKIPYVVVPPTFHKDFPTARLGDYVAVTYGGKTVYAIIGDIGPAGVIGAGSIALAAALGMDPTPKTGGAAGGVTYMVIPGSRNNPPPRDAGTIQSNGRLLFDGHGMPVN